MTDDFIDTGGGGEALVATADGGEEALVAPGEGGEEALVAVVDGGEEAIVATDDGSCRNMTHSDGSSGNASAVLLTPSEREMYNVLFGPDDSVAAGDGAEEAVVADGGGGGEEAVVAAGGGGEEGLVAAGGGGEEALVAAGGGGGEEALVATDDGSGSNQSPISVTHSDGSSGNASAVSLTPSEMQTYHLLFGSDDSGWGEGESSSSVLPRLPEAEEEGIGEEVDQIQGIGEEADQIQGIGEEADQIQGMGDHCKRCLLLIKDDQLSLICNSCALSYHVHCLRHRESAPAIPLWYCPACLCAICRYNENVHLVELCHTCHTGYHTYCLAPSLELAPDEKWSCRLCRVRLEVVRRREMWEQRRAS